MLVVCETCPAIEQLAARDELIESLQGENAALRAKVAALAEIAFPHSERKDRAPGDDDLAGGDEVPGDDEPAGDAGEPARTGGVEGGADESFVPRRGQRRGAPGHGRRRYDDLSIKTVVHELGDDQRCCPRCKMPYEGIEGAEVSAQIEWRVEVYRIEHHRKRYARRCRCEAAPAVIVAPVPAKVIPKGLLTAEAIARALVDKFLLARPANKIVIALSFEGLDLAPGTLVGVFSKVAGLLAPLHEALFVHARQAGSWNCDETSWACFTDPDNTTGRRRRWWCWVARAHDVTVFRLVPSRAAKVLETLLGANDEAVSGIVCSDMYGVYPTLDQVRFVNAYCWAHVRRHIMRAAASMAALRTWADAWLELISTMYAAWHARRDGVDDGSRLKEVVATMSARLTEQLATPELAAPAAKVLAMMDSHWAGLVVFVTHLEIAPDNNAAEQVLRPEVLGRKNYGGSGMPWAADLAASAFSVFATIAQWRLNPLSYCSDSLSACASSGGRAPAELGPFLPWSASTENLERWRSPP